MRLKDLVYEQMNGIEPMLFLIMMILGFIILQIVWLIRSKYKNISIPLSYKLGSIFLLIYLCFMFQITLCNRETGSRNSINIIPFLNFYHWTGELNESRILYAFLNCLLFVPFGFLISYFKSHYQSGQMLLLITSKCFLLSVVIELIQLITSRGFFETEDLICNTVGGMIGCILFTMLLQVFPKIRLKQM